MKKTAVSKPFYEDVGRHLQSEAAAAQEPQAVYRIVELELVDESPNNPRKHFDEAALAELADSIRAHGVVEPVLVRPMGGRYELVAGARRVRASRMAGLTDTRSISRTTPAR